MNEELQISLRMEGVEDEEGFIRLSDFMDKLDALKESLDAVDKVVNRKRRSTLYYRIVKITQNSPLCVVIEPVRRASSKTKDGEALTRATHHKFFSNLSSIRDNAPIPEDLDSNQIEALERLVTGRDGKFSGLEINNNETKITVDEELEKSVVKLAQTSTHSYGSIEGRLEAVNFHGDKVFYIYPFVGPKKIKCEISSLLVEEAEKVQNALMQRVKVFGKMHYRLNDKFPHRVSVQGIEIGDSKPIDILGSRGLIGDGKKDSLTILSDCDEW